MNTSRKSKRIFYFDALRALAILCVIIIHVFNKTSVMTMGDFGAIHSLNWFISDTSLIFFRIGVSLFLMLSGALSLGREWDIKSFLGKRIPRIVGPYLFWGLALSLLAIFSAYFFNYNYLKIDITGIDPILNFIFNAYMAKSPGFYSYWFFWMILGTYLIMPIFNKWLLHSDLREAEYFLAFWLITCLFDFTLFISFPIKLAYFTSPIGLVVLGYYLRHTDRKLLNNPYFSILLIIVPGLVMMAISYLYSTQTEFFLFDRYSIFGAIEVAGVFTLFKNFNKLNFRPGFLYNPSGIFRRLVAALAKYSYGMYLTHAMLIKIMAKPIMLSCGYKMTTLLLMLACTFIPLGVLALLNRIPYINQIIGAK